MRKLFVTPVLCIISLSMIYAIKLPHVFSDNMVLQQQTNVKIWGTASPGEHISITTDWGEKAETETGKDGTWMTDLKTPEAGGPYKVTVTGKDNTIIINNVLIGEVWLCSGQSNMEMPLTGWPPRDTILNSATEIKNADYSKIRYLEIPKAYSPVEENDFSGEWVICSPETAGTFSATAYFFAKKIQKELNVPVGLIQSSWGGTPVEAWMDKKTLENIDDYKEILQNLEEVRPFVEAQKKWLDKQDMIQIDVSNPDVWKDLSLNDSELTSVNYDDSGWETMQLPVLWEDAGWPGLDGVVWFRKKITVPEDWKGADIVLELARIDDMDATYMNGIKVGGYEQKGYWSIDRVYEVKPGILKSGENQIAVRVIDDGGGGGIYRDPNRMKIYAKGHTDTISLAGSWKYLPIAEYRAKKLYVYTDRENGIKERPELNMELSQYTPSALFNGMIHPVVPYAIKGVIWYQGEQNASYPESYYMLFSNMILGWRELWAEGSFPFYYVQIAPYRYGKETKSYLVREAQLKTLSVPHTGMAVTLDIGDSTNIHPANKQEVGRRLALWALDKDYGKHMVCSGPVYSSMVVKEGKAVLSFNYVGSGLMARDGKLENFLIAGKDNKFVKATAKIEGDKVIVYSSEVKEPVAVRYLWDNTSYASLFNKEGLPASSFSTED